MFVFTVASPFRLRGVTASRPCHVSSPRHVERSVQISRTTLTCLLHAKVYFAPAGLSPAEHTSLYWTHFRTAGFLQYGSKAGLSGRAFPNHVSVKLAPSMPVT